jgi:glycerophosphoryl diester phosphodiesterase
MHKKIKIFVKFLLLFVAGTTFLISLIFLWLTLPMKSTDHDVLSNREYYIAHGGGGMEGHIQMNCKEGLMHSLANGYKYIELDLGLTTDSNLVCIHDWASFHKKTIGDTSCVKYPISTESFRKRKILESYTPLTIEDAIAIRDQHPYIIVTDKISDPTILNRFFTRERNNIIVEAFNLADYSALKDAGYIPMMSLWEFDYSKLFRYFIYYRLVNGIKIDWICVSSKSNMKSLRIVKRLFNCKVAMYSSNSPEFFTNHLGKEIDMIYTDDWDFQTKK